MSESDVVIRVERLGKQYSLHHERSERYTSLRDVLARQANAAGRLLNPFTLAGQLHISHRPAPQEHAASQEEFWALKDVSFEIRRGERVGIIGRNGAGKSTLLKILSRITEPTTGRVEIRGRVASLLEVGTGFHPELTGRENIYLNGAILGMTRREIRYKFDEIVDFAEVEKFLDTPVKRYSSGMYVRLAFAVAAHLEPEILVLDEVLAVGDADFQKKCLGKMEDVAEREGRTILFVSHQMAAIQHLCTRALLMSNGACKHDSSTTDCINYYLKSSRSIPKSLLKGRKDRQGNGLALFIDAFFTESHSQEKCLELVAGRSYSLCLIVDNQSARMLEGVVISYAVTDEFENNILLFRSNFEGAEINLRPGLNIISSFICNLPLAPSSYSLTLFGSLRDAEVLDSITRAQDFRVVHSEFYANSCQGLPSHCKVLKETQWLCTVPNVETDAELYSI